MGEENKPQVSFLNRRGAPPPAAPVQPDAPAVPAVPPASSLPAAPEVPTQPPAGPAPSAAVGVSSARLSGKFKAPGNKSIFGNQPRMSAIRGSVSQVMTQSGG